MFHAHCFIHSLLFSNLLLIAKKWIASICTGEQSHFLFLLQLTRLSMRGTIKTISKNIQLGITLYCYKNKQS